jgi:hypothetical protein
MLSPNAMIWLTDSCGGRVTVTTNEQVARWLPASVAVHVTVVAPAWNPLPEPGVQLVCTGAVPPAVAGAVHVIVTGWFWSETPDCAAGHDTVNVAGGWGVGVVGELPPHRAASADTPTTATSARSVRR